MSTSAINLPVSIFIENKHFIAYTPALDLSTTGKSFEEAQKRFDEVVQIFFEELADKGTTNEVLTNLGWKKVASKWNPPIEVAHRLETFSMPSAI